MKTLLKHTEPLSEAQRASVISSLNSVSQALPFLVGLSPAERRSLAKMGPKSRAFVEDAIEAGLRNPDMLPRSLDPEKTRGAMLLVDQLREIAAITGQLKERLDDTVMLAGAGLYDAARLIYTLTKTSVKADGLNETRQGLSRRFAGQGRRSADGVTAAGNS